MTPEQVAADYFHRILTVPDDGPDALDLMLEIADFTSSSFTDDGGFVAMMLIGALSGSLRDVLDAVDLTDDLDRSTWAFQRAAMILDSRTE